jgi:hypothetical protein
MTDISMLHKPPHIQEITFDNKTKLTLKVDKIVMGNWTHIDAEGKEYIINTDRVLFIKVYKKNKTDYER